MPDRFANAAHISSPQFRGQQPYNQNQFGYGDLYGQLAGNMVNPLGPGNSNMGWANQANAATLGSQFSYDQNVAPQLLRSNADIDIANINSGDRRYLADTQAGTINNLLPSIFGSLSSLAGGGPQRPGSPQQGAPQPTAAAPTLSTGQPWQALLQQLMQQGQGAQ